MLGIAWNVFKELEYFNQTVTPTRYVGWSVCHEEVAEEIFKLIKVSLGLVYKKDISFQRPTFLHPEAALPDHPWVFIGFGSRLTISHFH